jgi:hypothetical protein
MSYFLSCIPPTWSRVVGYNFRNQSEAYNVLHVELPHGHSQIHEIKTQPCHKKLGGTRGLRGRTLNSLVVTIQIVIFGIIKPW